MASSLCRSEMELKSVLLDSIGDGVIAHTLNGAIIYANHKAAEMLGYDDVVELGAIEPWGWLPHEDRNTVPHRIHRIRAEGTAVFESQCLSRDNRHVSVECHARLVSIEPWGELVICAKRDITSRWEVQERMRQLAFSDPLTGLGNRTLLENRLATALAAAEGNDLIVGLIYMDLDDFKPINDTHGHAMGDRVLQIIAERMLNCVRDTDTIARVGGDEFVALFPNLSSIAGLCAKAEAIASNIKAPICLDGTVVGVSVSVGLAIHEDGEHYNDLICRADHAMYRAKSHGRPGWEELVVID